LKTSNFEKQFKIDSLRKKLDRALDQNEKLHQSQSVNKYHKKMNRELANKLETIDVAMGNFK
jgi:hypothetical protein